jgi:hypothetical protein
MVRKSATGTIAMTFEQTGLLQWVSDYFSFDGLVRLIPD